MGLYPTSEAATVLTPQPENDSAFRSVRASLRARSGLAMPAKRQCPAFEVLTRHGWPWPSSAIAYVERSSHQNADSKFLCRTSAFLPNSEAQSFRPSAVATVAAARRAAYTYACTSHRAIGPRAGVPSAWKIASRSEEHT